jgi:hypothetical protein
VGWRSAGHHGHHEWRFEPTAERVHVTTTESFAGDPVDADTAGMQTLLDNSMVTWLGRLKTEAERHR